MGPYRLAKRLASSLGRSASTSAGRPRADVCGDAVASPVGRGEDPAEGRTLERRVDELAARVAALELEAGRDGGTAERRRREVADRGRGGGGGGGGRARAVDGDRGEEGADEGDGASTTMPEPEFEEGSDGATARKEEERGAPCEGEDAGVDDEEDSSLVLEGQDDVDDVVAGAPKHRAGTTEMFLWPGARSAPALLMLLLMRLLGGALGIIDKAGNSLTGEIDDGDDEFGAVDGVDEGSSKSNDDRADVAPGRGDSKKKTRRRKRRKRRGRGKDKGRTRRRQRGGEVPGDDEVGGASIPAATTAMRDALSTEGGAAAARLLALPLVFLSLSWGNAAFDAGATSSVPSPAIPRQVVGEDAPTGWEAFADALFRPPADAVPDLSDDSTSRCQGSDPATCGCGSVNLADYRGSIAVSRFGDACVPWDESRYPPEDYPDAGLEGNSFCRNPTSDKEVLTWCYVGPSFRDWEYCEVPVCFPPAASCPREEGAIGEEALEALDAACDYHRCVQDSGYLRESTPLGFDEAPSGCLCPYEIWDCKFGSKICTVDPVRKEAYDCCAGQAKDSSWTADKASCECTIKVECQAGNADRCIEYAQNCCAEADDECQCEYNGRACRLALANGPTDAVNAGQHCASAEVSCCKDDCSLGGCKCDFWVPLCEEFPNAEFEESPLYYGTCDASDWTCCGNTICRCDVHTFAVNVLGYHDPKNLIAYVCGSKAHMSPDHTLELEMLQGIYNETGGDNWFNNAQWLTASNHCEWYGIVCDDEGFITEITLRNNRLSGGFPANFLSKLYKLKTLDLADNRLWGTMAGTYETKPYHLSGYDEQCYFLMPDTTVFFNLRGLTHVDLSQNQLTGEVDVLFAPSLTYANFSHNNITSIESFKKFKLSHESLRVVDLSYNSIGQDVKKLMKNMPPNIEQWIVSNNPIWGSISASLEELRNLRVLKMGYNRLSGDLPEFSTPYPNLQVLDLSNQKHDVNGGFVGAIPASIANLGFLSTLDLAGNGLVGSIPPVLGKLAQIKVLDLSNNGLSESIPEELGALGFIQVLNLSTNRLSGLIPSELGNLQDASVYLSGNPDLSSPAPLDLCFSPNFDLMKISDTMCPAERNGLKEFYDAAKGREWTESQNWTDPYISHCHWLGVTCDDTNRVINLTLSNNGLSGKLSPFIANLTNLEVLDLNNNDIKGSVPQKIGLLTNMTYLRLSYNAFTGNVPTELGQLKNLELFHLHGNRISGTVPPEIRVLSTDESSFISDCGVPTPFQDALDCEGCTLCCNSQGDCLPTQKNTIQSLASDTINTYVSFTAVVFLSVLGLCCVAYLGSLLYEKYKRRWGLNLSRSLMELRNEKALATDIIGDDSVYKFFLTKSWRGWFIALATIGLQCWLLGIFVQGAERDLQDDNSDLVYTYLCPRDQDTCEDRADLTNSGWAAFGILMVFHLTKDLIGGTRLVVLAAREGHHWHSRARFFLGGLMLNVVTCYTLFSSAIYNKAIASGDTEIIANSVIILFICDIDELVYDILKVINWSWLDRLIEMIPNTDDEKNLEKQQKLEKCEREVDDLREQLRKLQAHVGYGKVDSDDFLDEEK